MSNFKIKGGQNPLIPLPKPMSLGSHRNFSPKPEPQIAVMFISVQWSTDFDWKLLCRINGQQTEQLDGNFTFSLLVCSVLMTKLFPEWQCPTSSLSLSNHAHEHFFIAKSVTENSFMVDPKQQDPVPSFFCRIWCVAVLRVKTALKQR